MTSQGLLIPSRPTLHTKREAPRAPRPRPPAPGTSRAPAPRPAQRPTAREGAPSAFPADGVLMPTEKLEKLLGKGPPRGKGGQKQLGAHATAQPSRAFMRQATRMLKLDKAPPVARNAREARELLKKGPTILVMRGARKKRGGRSRPRPDNDTHEKSLAIVLRPAGVGVHVDGHEYAGELAIVMPLAMEIETLLGDPSVPGSTTYRYLEHQLDGALMAEFSRLLSEILEDGDMDDFGALATLLNSDVYFDAPGTAQVVELAESDEMPGSFDPFGKRILVAVIGTRAARALDEKRARWVLDALEKHRAATAVRAAHLRMERAKLAR